MTFYLIGLGLNLKSISLEALESLNKCKEIYLENYTVDFPYEKKQLEESIGKKVLSLERGNVESEKFIKKTRNEDIALLVYGNPLSATTHIQLILKCKKENIPYKIIHSESILTAIAETGLQIYKFGKTTSMPKFSKNYEPDSWFDIILQNEKIKAHTLLLTDIGLTAKEAIEQLEKTGEKRNIEIDKLIICSHVGTKKSKIYYDKADILKKQAEKEQINMPFCIIIPTELHFVEKEALEMLKEDIKN
jgi:diphthine synthase